MTYPATLQQYSSRPQGNVSGSVPAATQIEEELPQIDSDVQVVLHSDEEVHSIKKAVQCWIDLQLTRALEKWQSSCLLEYASKSKMKLVLNVWTRKPMSSHFYCWLALSRRKREAMAQLQAHGPNPPTLEALRGKKRGCACTGVKSCLIQ